MRLHWPVFLTRLTALFASSAADVSSKYNREPAPAFLFERRPFTFNCAETLPGRSATNRGETRAFLRASNEAPYLLTRLEELTLSTSDVPALTITADPSNMIAIAGSERRDLFIRFCARAEGESETEAREYLQQIAMTRQGGVVSLRRRSEGHGQDAMSYFLLEAPVHL